MSPLVQAATFAESCLCRQLISVGGHSLEIVSFPFATTFVFYYYSLTFDLLLHLAILFNHANPLSWYSGWKQT